MYSHFRSGGRFLALATLAVAIGGCERMDRKVHQVASPGRLDRPIAMQGDLQPGTPARAVRMENPFEGDAAALAEGRRLYLWYNCAGCHFNGGGGIGPPLMDDEWIYGGENENIYDSIYRGRPNGMPAFGGRVPEVQMWKITAYVRSMNPDRKPEEPGRDEPEPGSEPGKERPGQGSATRPEGGSNR
jgi:cytochrome c oxidase cbb3-type subunit III